MIVFLLRDIDTVRQNRGQDTAVVSPVIILHQRVKNQESETSREAHTSVNVCYAPSMREKAGPIVTRGEIQRAQDLLSSAVVKSMRSTRGFTDSMREAEPMCPARKSTSVPVPEAFSTCMIEDVAFILMHKVPGTPLEGCWDHLSNNSLQGIIVQQLCGQVSIIKPNEYEVREKMNYFMSHD